MPHQTETSGIARGLRRPGPATAAIGALAAGMLALGGIGVSRVDPGHTAKMVETLSSAWSRLVGTSNLTALERIEPRINRVAVPMGAPSGAGTRADAAPLMLTRPAAGNVLAFGDRLKITFFESLGIALGDGANTQASPPITTIFPRMDLSGEYVIDDAGEVDIPRLGRFAAAGQSTAALEAELVQAFQHALGRTCDVHVAILDRQPIYVLGGPRGGAIIKHAPGMMVLQALAEAGGYQRGAGDTSRAIELIRERQRLGEAEDRLARMLVRQARLIALRDGLSTVTLTPDLAARMPATVSKDIIAALLAEADTTLGMERRAYEGQLTMADRLVDIAQGEVEAQKMRLMQARALAQSKAARLRDLEAIAARGSVSQFKLADAGVEIAELAAKQEDLHVAVTQAESRLAEAELARAKLLEANTAQITRDLAAAGQEVADLIRSVSAMRAVLAVLGDTTPITERGQSGLPRLRIVRRVTTGTLSLPATEATPLMAGDVLQIDLIEPAAQPAANGASPASLDAVPVPASDARPRQHPS